MIGARGGLYAYRESRKLEVADPPFSALIWAAMRKADTDNLALLRAAWPDLWDELQVRYWAPGGLLPEEAAEAAEREAQETTAESEHD